MTVTNLWEAPAPRFGKGDVCWHKGINQKINIDHNPVYAAGHFAYSYHYIDDTGQQHRGSVSERSLASWDAANEVRKGEKVEVNLTPQTPIRKTIESISSSLPKGDEIKKSAGSIARAVVKERQGARKSFQGLDDFIWRMEASGIDFPWRALGEQFSYKVPEKPIGGN